jgi:hypothetical protein
MINFFRQQLSLSSPKVRYRVSLPAEESILNFNYFLCPRSLKS